MPWNLLAHFGPSLRPARTAYHTFVAAGTAQGRRPELQGGCLDRSLGGWTAVARLRRGRDGYAGDQRILGSAACVKALQHALPPSPAGCGAALPIEEIIQRACTRRRIDPRRLRRGGRKLAVSQARAGIAYLSTEVAGHPGRALAPLLGVRPVSIYAAARRGLADQGRWDALVDHPQTHHASYAATPSTNSCQPPEVRDNRPDCP